MITIIEIIETTNDQKRRNNKGSRALITILGFDEHRVPVTVQCSLAGLHLDVNDRFDNPNELLWANSFNMEMKFSDVLRNWYSEIKEVQIHELHTYAYQLTEGRTVLRRLAD